MSANNHPDRYREYASIRAEFAARAMEGILANSTPVSGSPTNEQIAEKIAELSVMMADALIKELNKTTS